MSEQKDIREYYDELAKDYDLSRFGNTYGEFINKQEEKCLVPILRLFELMHKLENIFYKIYVSMLKHKFLP